MFRLMVCGVIITCLGCASGGSRSLHSNDGQIVSDGAPCGCGNSVVESGEACDDGNTNEGDGCSPQCEIEPGWSCSGDPSVCTRLCGNNQLDGDEQCDGALLNGQSCTTVPGGFSGGTLGCTASCTLDTANCVLASCGDENVDEGEQCDDGNESNEDACLNNCQRARCGDGHTQTGVEQCDDGNTASGDGCNASCVIEFCGDGIVQFGIGEQCEGSGSQPCTTICTTAGTRTCQENTCKWSICEPPGESCNAQDDDCDSVIDMSSCLVTIHRYFRASPADHMFAASLPSGYALETPSFKVYQTQVPGTIPLYQRFNGTNHMQTLDPNEGSGDGYYQTETIGFVVEMSPWVAAGFASSQLYRYYNTTTNDHLLHTYISNADLPNQLPGYQREGTTGIVWDFHY